MSRIPMSVRALVFIESIVWTLRCTAQKGLFAMWNDNDSNPPQWIEGLFCALEHSRYALQSAINKRGYNVYGNKL